MSDYHNIFIIGAGAIGKALAVALHHYGRNVTLIRASVNNIPDQSESIEVILPDQSYLKANILTSTLSQFDQLNGIIIITCKSFANKDLSLSLKDRIDTSPVVIMQNGLNVERPFLNNGYKSIYRCVLFATSQFAGENKLSFKPVSPSPIGTFLGNSKELNAIIQQLNTHVFQFTTSENIEYIIWKKAIINCAFNSICPLLNTDNGIFHRDKVALGLANRIIKEGIEVAACAGINLVRDELMDLLLLISQSSKGQLISTLQDLENKRPTEIEFLNLAIAETARSLKKENLARETKLLGELILLKSQVANN